MSENTVEFDGAAFVRSIFENAVFVLGMFLMFSKTVDLMTAFAPNSFLGYVDVQGYYGLACGALVEGALIVMKFLLPKTKSPIEWLWNVVVVVTPFLISALAQPIDSMVVRNTLSQQPQEMQVFATWFVPSIPTLIIGLFIGREILSSIPKEFLPKGFPVLKVPNSTKITFPNPFAALGSKNGHKEPQLNPTQPPSNKQNS